MLREHGPTQSSLPKAWSWPGACVWLCQRQGDTDIRSKTKGGGQGEQQREDREENKESPVRESPDVSDRSRRGAAALTPWVPGSGEEMPRLG